MARNLDKSSIPENWKYDFLDKFAIRCSGHTLSYAEETVQLNLVN